MLIVLPLVIMAAIVWTSYQAVRWAYGAVVQAPVGLGNNSASFQPEAGAEATGNEVRRYLDLNLVKVGDEKAV